MWLQWSGSVKTLQGCPWADKSRPTYSRPKWKASLHCVSAQSTSGRPADSAFPWPAPESVKKRERGKGWTVGSEKGIGRHKKVENSDNEWG